MSNNVSNVSSNPGGTKMGKIGQKWPAKMVKMGKIRIY